MGWDLSPHAGRNGWVYFLFFVDLIFRNDLSLKTWVQVTNCFYSCVSHVKIFKTRSMLVGLNWTPDKQAKAAFASLVKWQVGEGTKTLFWKDRWISGATIGELAPLVYKQVRTQIVNKRRVKDALWMHGWTDGIAGQLCTEGLAQFIRLWGILIDM